MTEVLTRGPLNDLWSIGYHEITKIRKTEKLKQWKNTQQERTE